MIILSFSTCCLLHLLNIFDVFNKQRLKCVAWSTFKGMLKAGNMAAPASVYQLIRNNSLYAFPILNFHHLGQSSSAHFTDHIKTISQFYAGHPLKGALSLNNCQSQQVWLRHSKPVLCECQLNVCLHANLAVDYNSNYTKNSVLGSHKAVTVGDLAFNCASNCGTEYPFNYSTPWPGIVFRSLRLYVSGRWGSIRVVVKLVASYQCLQVWFESKISPDGVCWHNTRALWFYKSGPRLWAYLQH